MTSLATDKSYGMSREQMEASAPLDPVPAGQEPLFKIRNLDKSFSRRHILRGIDIDIYRGETLVILGGSGSGKTTLLRHLMGMLRPDEGSIQVNFTGSSVRLDRATSEELDAYRAHLGVVFQGAALLNSLTVLENVGLPLVEVRHLPAQEVFDKVVAALQKVYLPAGEILHLKPAALSGGMRKRVGIARAIVQEPELILYDEPTTGLDPVTVSGVNELTLDLQKRLGVTSVVITHDIDAAFKIADRIAMLYKGRIIAIGTKETFRTNPNPAVQQLLTGSTQGPLTEAFLQGQAQ